MQGPHGCCEWQIYAASRAWRFCAGDELSVTESTLALANSCEMIVEM
jgi:hypothetical protein